MYRSRAIPSVNFPIQDLPTLESYRAAEDSDSYKKNRMSSSKVFPLYERVKLFVLKERPRVSNKHRLLSNEKPRVTERERDNNSYPHKRLEAEFLSTKEMNRDVWPQYRNEREVKENENTNKF